MKTYVPPFLRIEKGTNHGNSVRIRCSFGQDLGFSSASCPNPALIRTGYELLLGFLSESGSLSDRIWAFPRLPVRIRLSFGQVMGFSSASCTNPALFRTGYGLFLGFLSESGSHSDRGRAFLRLPVRIQLSFGQDMDFSSAFCPNLASHRTFRKTSKKTAKRIAAPLFKAVFP